MKKLLFAVTLTMLFTSAVFAGSCPTNTLNNFLGNSCSVGNLLFSNFTYTSSASGSAVAISASGIEVTPLVVNGEVGLNFSAGWSAGPGQGLDSLIGFTVTAMTGSISDMSLSMGGAGFSNSGVATVAENASNGTNLFVFDDAGGTSLTDSATFVPVTSLTVSKDVTVDGFADGTAAISSVNNLYSSTPEPTTLGLLGTGLIGLAGLLRRFGRSA
jgi:hypothetical protein